MFQKLTWSVFISRESGADAAHLLLQHGLPGLAVPLPQRHGRPHPRLYGEYPFKHTPVGYLNKVRGLFVNGEIMLRCWSFVNYEFSKFVKIYFLNTNDTLLPFSRSSKRCKEEKLACNCRTVERSPVRYVASPGSRRWPNNGHPPLIRPNYQRPWAANNGQSFQITTTNPRGHAQLARGVENRPRPARRSRTLDFYHHHHHHGEWLCVWGASALIDMASSVIRWKRIATLHRSTALVRFLKRMLQWYF